MDIDKLIKRIKRPQIQSCPMDGEYPSCKACQKSIQQEVTTDLSTLQAENEKLRAELEQAHEDNKKLCAAMMSIAGTDDIARNEIVFRVSYEDVLTHDSVRDVAEILMRELLREDLKRREIRED